MGGSDDPSNLVELSVEEHAAAHRILFEQHGMIEDYCAWKGLSGQISKQQIILELQKVGGRRSAELAYENGTHNFQIKNASTYEHVKQLRSRRMVGNDYGSLRNITDEYRNKQAEGARGNTNVRGTKWWTDGICNKRSKDCPGDGFYHGFTKKEIV